MSDEGKCPLWSHPCEYVSIVNDVERASEVMEQAKIKVEAQAAEIEAYRRSLYLKQTLISDQAAEIDRLREALTKISLRKWNSMTQGCNAAREASNIARAALAGKAEQ